VSGCTSSETPDPVTGEGLAASADLVVAPEGGDHEDLQSAVDAAEEGDLIAVEPGEYPGEVVIDTGGAEDAPLRIVAIGEGAVIGGTIAVEAPWVELEGLELDGTGGEGGFTDDSAITVSAAHVTVRDASIDSFGGWGVNFSPGDGDEYQRAGHGLVTGTRIVNTAGGVTLLEQSAAVGNEIERINSHGDETAPGDAFRVFGSGTRIAENRVFGSKPEEIRPIHADMVQSWDDVRQTVADVVIEDNVFTGWFNQGVMIENDAHPDERYIRDWTIRNNVFQGFESWGIAGGKEGGGVPGLLVEHNTFVGGGDDGGYFGVVFVGEGGSGVVRNNIIANVSQTAYGTQDGAEMDAAGSLLYDAPEPRSAGEGDVVDRDPRFADAASGDFTLLPGSPAIGAAVDDDAGDVGAATAEPMGAQRDIGAMQSDD
jgi:hypothetical protein